MTTLKKTIKLVYILLMHQENKQRDLPLGVTNFCMLKAILGVAFVPTSTPTVDERVAVYRCKEGTSILFS